MRRALLCVGGLIIGVVAPVSVGLAQAPVPVLTIDAAASRHPINPDIYGIANYGLDPAFAAEIRVPNVRWGGDDSTRYDWLVDSSNAGFDWFFMGGSGQTNAAPGASVDQMISTYATAGARALITIPIIPFVNRSAALTCSFPVSIYGPQEKTDPYNLPNGDQCGNSISTLGQQIIDTDIYANHVDNSVSLQQSWIGHLISTFGTAANGGVPYYQLDNEPSGWSNTHRDVMPSGAAYPQIVSLGQNYAAMIKASDPSAQVFGPSDYSGDGWVGSPSQQNGLSAGQYYLQQMAAYEQQHGQRILDYFDEHYYATSSDDASELASTRTLWDPTYSSYESRFFHAPLQLIPRFESWIQQSYPGTKLSISEYGFSTGRNPLVDGLTQADVLGIFGREGLDFANLWTVPMPPASVLCVFKLFRNYDGQGSQFGDVSVEADSTNQSALSIYAAQRSGDQALTVLVINKTTQPIATALTLSNFSAAGASVFSYSAANITSISPTAPVGIVSNQLNCTYPPYSATLFVLPDAAPAPPTITSLSTSAFNLTVGQAVTFSTQVSVPNGGPVPAGSISFLNGQTLLGTATLAGGAASFTTSALSPGPHTITAAYSGQVNYGASVSAPLNVTVSAPPDYSISLSSATLQVAPGSSSNLIVTVQSQPGFAASLNFNCFGLPNGASCAFNPPTLAPNGGSASTAVTIAISGSTGATFSPYRFRYVFFLLILALSAIFALLCLRRSRISVNARIAFLMGFLMFCAGGCALKSSAQNVQQATAGSEAYVVSVSASGANAPVHSQQFMLTVQ